MDGVFFQPTTGHVFRDSSDCPPAGDWPRWPRDPSCGSGDAASTWGDADPVADPVGNRWELTGDKWLRHENMVKAWEHGLTLVSHHKMGKHHQYSNHLLVCGFNPKKTINMEGWPIQTCGLKLWSPGKEYGDVMLPHQVLDFYSNTHTHCLVKKTLNHPPTGTWEVHQW